MGVWGLCSIVGTKHVNTISVFNKFRNKPGVSFKSSLEAVSPLLDSRRESHSLCSSLFPARPHVKLTETHSVV